MDKNRLEQSFFFKPPGGEESECPVASLNTKGDRVDPYSCVVYIKTQVLQKGRQSSGPKIRGSI